MDWSALPPLVLWGSKPTNLRSAQHWFTEKVDYDIIVIAADHAAYYTLDEDYFCQRTRTGALVADLNGIYRNKINQRNYWTL